MATPVTDPGAPVPSYAGGRDHSKDKIAIVVSRYGPHITERLYDGAEEVLLSAGVRRVAKHYVPGAYELPLAARHLAESRRYHAILCMGCIIRGETRHNEYISAAVADGLMRVMLKYSLPVLFGVLTPENEAQALARAGGSHGNKGWEVGLAALDMLDLLRTPV